MIEEKIQITKSDKVVLLGDYIDRGSQSKEVIDYIIELQNNGFDIVPLLGNHEAMLLDAFDKDERLSLWIKNGGSETLRSFGISSLKNLAPRYLQFFNKLPYYFAFEDYLFVHAGFNDEIEDPFNDSYHMIWRCRVKYFHSYLKGKTIIHGHCVVPSMTCDEQIKTTILLLTWILVVRILIIAAWVDLLLFEIYTELYILFRLLVLLYLQFANRELKLRIMKKHNGMRPQDIVVLLKIIALQTDNWRNIDIANALHISPSEISEALNRCRIARLIDNKKDVYL